MSLDLLVFGHKPHYMKKKSYKCFCLIKQERKSYSYTFSWGHEMLSQIHCDAFDCHIGL